MNRISTPDRPRSVARLRAVEKCFGPTRALDGLDLDLRRGEVLALLGPNGAGKTTAISLWLGLLEPDAGEVTLFDRPPSEPAARARVGAMLQSTGVHPMLRVEEQIDLFRSYYPRPMPVDSLVEVADLDGLMGRRSNALSGGQRQRLMLALALAGDPELLFLDEPSAGMDAESRRRLWSRVRRLVAEEKTVLLTTHHLDEADALADRVAVLDRGRRIAEGTPAELEERVAGRLVRCVTTLDLGTLSRLDGVEQVSQRGATSEILTARAEDVLRQLLALDSGLRDLEVSGVGLERAFLGLTSAGRQHDGAPESDREVAA